MTVSILEDYLRKNFSEGDFNDISLRLKIIYGYFRSGEKINSSLWKKSDESIDNEFEPLVLDFSYYKFMVESCKKFESIFCKSDNKGCYEYSNNAIWNLISICLKLDKIFGKENVRDELLNKYSYAYMKKDWFSDFIMLNKEKDIKTVIYFDLRSDIENIVRCYIFNKLVDKQIISDDKYLKVAMWMAYNFRSEAVPSSPFRTPILSEPFRGNLIGYYSNSMEVYISGKKKKEYISEDEKNFLKETEVVRIPITIKIPESVQNKFDINERMITLFEKSNNVKQLICPNLVRVVLADDFDQRFRRSLDENNRVRPKMLFKGYRKNTEVKDDRENTAKSDGDLDL